MRLTLCLLIFLGGCSTSAIRCDAHLLPINLPAPVIAPGSEVQTPPARRVP